MTLQENTLSLEHFGVKGMRWGVRKTPKEDGSNRNKKIAISIGVGVVVAGAVLFGVRQKKLSEVREVNKYRKNLVDTNTKFIKNSAKVKMTDIPKPASKGQMSPETQKFLSDFAQRQTTLNRLANEDLKRGYDRSQIPLNLREYLPDWV